jgi:hypothetical protein
MSRSNRKWMGTVVTVALCGLLTACVVAAAGAGAGGGYYFTSRGVGSSVQGSIDDVAARAQSVLAEEQIAIQTSNSENGGDKREFGGKKNDLDVKIELERRGPNEVKAEIMARKNIVEWDKDYAQRLMDKLVKGSQAASR